MNRRNFLTTALCAIPLITLGQSKKKNQPKVYVKSLYSDKMHTQFRLGGILKACSVLQISDAHISLNSLKDQRYYEYSRRMSNAFSKVLHYKNHSLTTPYHCFNELIKIAKEKEVDMIMLTGDIFNYPSQDDVAAVLSKLRDSKVPFAYIAGNHDWHYEGMEGSPGELRRTWTDISLQPLYNGRNPLYYNVVVGEVNCVLIDNSTYQIQQNQYEFVKTQLEGKKPVALFMHIPIFSPGMSICCAHPEWGASKDESYMIERREQWSSEGNSQTTLDFAEMLYKSENLIGLFVGHEHEQIQTKYKNLNQFVSLPSYNGQYRLIEFLPA